MTSRCLLQQVVSPAPVGVVEEWLPVAQVVMGPEGQISRSMVSPVVLGRKHDNEITLEQHHCGDTPALVVLSSTCKNYINVLCALEVRSPNTTSCLDTTRVKLLPGDSRQRTMSGTAAAAGR